MKANILDLINENPSGLLELKSALDIPQYVERYGFGLKNTCTIFESKKRRATNDDWYAFKENSSLDGLFTVKAESSGDLLVVFIIEVVKNNKVYCYLVLSDDAFKNILNDKTQTVLYVHQMYSRVRDNDLIALNMAS